MLATKVKINQVTNLSDARYCAGMGVEILGFAVDEAAEAYVSPEKFAEIKGWIAGVRLFGETSENDPVMISEKLEKYALDGLQVQNPEIVTYLKRETDLPIILRLDASSRPFDAIYKSAVAFSPIVEFFLIDKLPNTLAAADLLTSVKDFSVLAGFAQPNAQKIGEWVEAGLVTGLALTGSDEIRPGFKDYGSLMDILEVLEEIN